MNPTNRDIEAELATAIEQVRAPDALRAAVVAQVEQARRREASRRRRRFALPRPRVLLPAGTAALAAVAAALVLALSVGGGGGAPSVAQAAPVALRVATAPAPASRPGGRALAAAVEGISFPRWEQLGWRATGQRYDRVGGHQVRTVFYTDARGHRLGYAIAAGDALPVSGGHVVRVGGTELHVLRLRGAHVVTWRRDGHTCIVAARDVAPTLLVGLATYET
jgi:hypothetical protein